MNWFGSKPKTNVPSQTNLQAHRAKQIDSLKKNNLSPIESIPNTEYRVTCQCGGNNIILIISLPPQFPQDPPTVTITPPVVHPWVDPTQKIVGCQNLNSFSMHSSLGHAIQSVVEEFKKNPPQIRSQPYGPQLGYPPVPPPNAQFSGFNPGGMAAGYPSPPTLPPSIPGGSRVSPVLDSRRQAEQSESTVTQNGGIPNVKVAFPELKKKSLSELNSILHEEEKVLEMIQNLPDVAKLAEDREKLSNECIGLARENLSKKPTILQMKQWVADKNSLFESMREEFESNQVQLMSESDKFQPTNIQTCLKVSLMEAEEEAENIVGELMDKKINIDEFMQKFIQTRMLCHTRRAKEEKLHQIIMQQGY
ncbi:vacuolar protein sorting-associated protein 37A-like [Pecten maximus]|uniref:vacuolar protein sorting-associated protein 37A-like n=1 Tax=Pecten maximus TaxID=6579 RepID=UPI00145883FA|nr:vacuolar protein sorting-associated protein 37A-like [Pecten maximus]